MARATGGSITYSGNYVIHTFSSSDDFVVTEPGTFYRLMVAGGASGGKNQGGGGGGGGVLDNWGGTPVFMNVGTYPVVIGAGGAGTLVNGWGSNGNPTTFNSEVAYAGGTGGGSNSIVDGGGQNGGCGGGGGGGDYASNGGLGSQGYDGGAGSFGTGNNGAGGGGGGGGAAGSAASSNVPGDGGNGHLSTITGSSVYYAGGGGGGRRTLVTGGGAAGGLGGGGDGSDRDTGPAGDGTDGLGGGGGGASGNSDGSYTDKSGDGGDGVVIIAYEITESDGFRSFADGYEIWTFTSSGYFLVPEDSDWERLIVGGGGGGGVGGTYGSGGGGGAGGVILDSPGSPESLTAGVYPVVVGAGGAGSTDDGTEGGSGGDSSFNGSTAVGGGGGGSSLSGALNGLSGGSGGGAGANNGSEGTGGAGTSLQGNDGGDGLRNAGDVSGCGGGGGGQSAAGTDATASTGGDGGAGVTSDITGTSVGYAGGGGGGALNNGTSSAGAASHGGGAGSLSGAGTNGTDGTGGGGGGGANTSGGDGGDGIVVLRRRISSGGTITYEDGYTIHTFDASGDFDAYVDLDVERLLLAGGGAGGSSSSASTSAAGGGAGGLLENVGGTVISLTAGTYPVVVGAGGAAYGSASDVKGSDGSDSTFNGATAVGGGAGGVSGDSSGNSGGSGGGARLGGSVGLGTAGQGYDGALFDGASEPGGGGGAGQAGQPGSHLITFSQGGDGQLVNITGTSTYYGGGGGGGGFNDDGTYSRSGGLGGGGDGQVAGTGSYSVSAGTDGLGGGGGGGRTTSGGDGGDGVFIVRYETFPGATSLATLFDDGHFDGFTAGDTWDAQLDVLGSLVEGAEAGDTFKEPVASPTLTGYSTDTGDTASGPYSSFVIAEPANVTEGDLLVLVVSAANSVNGISSISDSGAGSWMQCVTGIYDGSYNLRLLFYVRRVPAGGTGNITVNFSGGVDGYAAVVLGFTGVRSHYDFDNYYVISQDTPATRGSTTFGMAGIANGKTCGNNALYLSMMGWVDGSVDLTDLDDLTELVTIESGTGSTDVNLAVGSKLTVDSTKAGASSPTIASDVIRGSFVFMIWPAPPENDYATIMASYSPTFWWPLDGTQCEDQADGEENAHASTGQTVPIVDDAIIPANGSYCYRFTATGDAYPVFIDDNGDINSTSVSLRAISAWFIPDTLTGGPYIIWKEGGGTHGITLYIEDGYLVIAVTYSSNNTGYVRYLLPEIGLYHALAVCDFTDASTGIRLYVNGSLIGTDGQSTGGSLPSHSGDIGIGSAQSGTWRTYDGASTSTIGAFEGRIQDVAIWITDSQDWAQAASDIYAAGFLPVEESVSVDLVESAYLDDGFEAGDTFAATLTTPQNLVEGVDAGDTFAATAATDQNITDGAEGGDTFAGTAATDQNIADGAEGGDTFAGTAATDQNLTDGAEAGDAWATVAAMQGLLDEGLLAGDDFAATEATPQGQSEGAEAGETFAGTAETDQAVSDGFEAGDSWEALLIQLADIADGADAGDSWSAIHDALGLLSEGAAAGETLAAEADATAALSDGAAAGDTFAGTMDTVQGDSDGAVAGDTLAGAMSTNQAFAEGLEAGDVWEAIQDASVGLAEGAEAGDAFAATMETSAGLVDGVAAGDDWEADITIIGSTGDGAAAGDAFAAEADATAIDGEGFVGGVTFAGQVTTSAAWEEGFKGSDVFPLANLSANGRRPIGVAQLPGQGGENYPLIYPSDDVKYLLADMFLCYEDPDDQFVAPFRISRLYGFGNGPADIPYILPPYVQPHGVRIVDALGQVVFDVPKLSVDYDSENWGDDDRLRVVKFANGKTSSSAEPNRETLWIVYHQSWQAWQTPQIYSIYFEPDSAIIDPRCLMKMPPRVNTLNLGIDSFLGDISIKNGYNTDIQVGETVEVSGRRTTQIIVNASPGDGAGKFGPACDENDTPDIKNINGVAPNDNGNFYLDATGCYRIERPVIAELNPTPAREVRVQNHALKLSNDCGPCCECDDFVAVWEAIRKLRNRYANLVERAQAVRDQYHANRSRWTEQRECRLNDRLRVNLQPICPGELGIAVGYCNNSDECIEGLVLHMSFDYESIEGYTDADGESPLSATTSATFYEVSCNSTFRGGHVDPDRPKNRQYVKNEYYTLGGSYPYFWAHFPKVDPGAMAFVTFRVRFQGATAEDVVELVAEGFELGPGPVVQGDTPVEDYVLGGGCNNGKCVTTVITPPVKETSILIPECCTEESA